MSYHKILEKQIKKYFTEKSLVDESLVNFLKDVSNHYVTFERDRELSEHAYEISEKEFQETNARLKQQVDIRKQSIIKLKQAIIALDPTLSTQFNENVDDLIHVISFLEEQISKTKQLETELITAKEIAEKAATVKSEFLSTMSHEIRTPLNVIIGTINLLKVQELSLDQKELLKVMEISSENLISLINDVLDYSKLEERKIIFAEQDINLMRFLKNIKLAYRLRAEERGNTIKIIYDDDIPDYIVGDETRLGQVINNLISNAIKFTKNGQISVEVTLKEDNGLDVLLQFAVSDTGIGIPKEKQSIIFDRFMQANGNITREYGGSGLGLSIIRLLLKMQNSQIQVDSEPGKGSRFYFSLWFQKSNKIDTSEADPVEIDKNLKGMKVLLVEDMDFNVMVAQRMLQNWNAEVGVARNGVEAIDKVKQNEYDIILMDIQMPTMDGYTATYQIRQFNSTTPIIALTASTSIEVQDKIKYYGMNGYVSKPFNPNDLFLTILKTVAGKAK